MSIEKYIYFDNNATTIMPKNVIDTMVKCINLGNPSGLYKSAKFCQEIIQCFRDEIAKICEFSAEEYFVLFNSGASEGNNHIINATVNAYYNTNTEIPHIIISDVEHPSLMKCIDKLVENNRIEITKIKTHMRSIEPHELQKAIKENTILVAIMAANNETGIINDIEKLKAVVPRIPFYTDATQYVGKLHFKMKVDAFCASFHKMHGPKGCGVLVIKKSFIDGYKMCPFICGSQNQGQRGGTEPIHDIAASLSAFRHSHTSLADKIKYVAELRAYLAIRLCKLFKCVFLDDYEKSENPFIIFIAPKNFVGTLPNTILLTIKRANICNKAIRNGLEDNGIIVGLGSACNKGINNVVQTLGIPDELMSGVLRITLSYMNKKEEIEKFISVFAKLIVSDSVLKL